MATWRNLPPPIPPCKPAPPNVSPAQTVTLQVCRRGANDEHAVAHAITHARTERSPKPPPGVPPTAPQRASCLRALTSLRQGAATLGPLYGGRLGPADLRAGGIAHFPRGHLHGPSGVARDEHGITLVPGRGAVKMGEGLDFLRDHRERGTVYGNIMGAEEGLRAVARGGVGQGKAGNRLRARGLKGAPVSAWLGKGV